MPVCFSVLFRSLPMEIPMTTTPDSTSSLVSSSPTVATIIYSNSAKFPLGQIVATPGALVLLQELASALLPWSAVTCMATGAICATKTVQKATSPLPAACAF